MHIYIYIYVYIYIYIFVSRIMYLCISQAISRLAFWPWSFCEGSCATSMNISTYVYGLESHLIYIGIWFHKIRFLLKYVFQLKTMNFLYMCICIYIHKYVYIYIHAFPEASSSNCISSCKQRAWRNIYIYIYSYLFVWSLATKDVFQISWLHKMKLKSIDPRLYTIFMHIYIYVRMTIHMYIYIHVYVYVYI